MGSRVSGEVEGAFLKCPEGFIHLRHLSPVDAVQDDPVAIAERLTGTPYLWGGRSSDGLDCSGMVQLCFSLCGIALPRDTDQQMRSEERRVGKACVSTCRSRRSRCH